MENRPWHLITLGARSVLKSEFENLKPLSRSLLGEQRRGKLIAYYELIGEQWYLFPASPTYYFNYNEAGLLYGLSRCDGKNSEELIVKDHRRLDTIEAVILLFENGCPLNPETRSPRRSSLSLEGKILV